MSNSAPKTRRMGRFQIPRDWIDSDPSLVRNILGGLIVVRAEMLYNVDAIEYVAIADCFDEIDAGLMAPWYDVVINDRTADRVDVFMVRRDYSDPTVKVPSPQNTIANSPLSGTW